MSVIEPTPVAGHVRVKLFLDEVHAVKNPELAGKAEWTFRLWVNGLERWRTEKHIGVGQGKTVPVGAEIDIEVPATVDILELEVKAAELDLLSPDDQAGGEINLHRVAGFEKDRGFVLDVQGEGAHVQLKFSVLVEAM